MLNYINPQWLVGKLLLNYDKHHGAQVIIEGESDRLVYEKFFDRSSCRTQPGYSKKTIIGALNKLNELSSEGRNKPVCRTVVAIVDADFAKIYDGDDCNSFRGENLFQTDTHDVETMIITPGTLSQVLRTFGDRDKCDDYLVNPDALLELLIKLGLPIGMLRYVSIKYNYYLNFSNLDFTKFTDPSSLKLDIDNMVSMVISNTKSSSQRLRKQEIRAKLDKELVRQVDKLQICCGHDLVEILALLFIEKLGPMDRGFIPKGFHIAQILSATYEPTEFKKTKLFHGLEQWEKRNNISIFC